MRITFRVGPILILMPVIAWAALWNAMLKDESYPHWYIIGPIWALWLVAAVWNVALIIRESPRLAYLVYAFLFLPTLYLVCAFGVDIAIRFPL